MGVTILAAFDHVREPAHPVVLVRVVVGEKFVLLIHRHVENVAHAAREDFQPRAIRPEPEHAAARQIHARTVAPHRSVETLVADGDVEKAVHAEAKIGRHMIVPVQRPRLGVRLLNQVRALPAHSIVVGEDGELRVVQDVESAFEILHPENRVELFREDREASVGMKAKDAALGRIRVPRADVHRIFRDEDASVRRSADDRWVIDARRFRDEFDAPPGQGRRHPGGERGRGGCQKERNDRAQLHDHFAEKLAASAFNCVVGRAPSNVTTR